MKFGCILEISKSQIYGIDKPNRYLLGMCVPIWIWFKSSGDSEIPELSN